MGIKGSKPNIKGTTGTTDFCACILREEHWLWSRNSWEIVGTDAQGLRHIETFRGLVWKVYRHCSSLWFRSRSHVQKHWLSTCGGFHGHRATPSQHPFRTMGFPIPSHSWIPPWRAQHPRIRKNGRQLQKLWRAMQWGVRVKPCKNWIFKGKRQRWFATGKTMQISKQKTEEMKVTFLETHLLTVSIRQKKRRCTARKTD